VYSTSAGFELREQIFKLDVLADLRARAGTAKVTLEGPSDAIASANLQSHIAEFAASVGVTVGSTESLPVETRGLPSHRTALYAQRPLPC
jgi:hypothetical protein